MITQQRLKQLLDYDPTTGIFTWKVRRGGSAKAGSVAGCKKFDGYNYIKIDDKPCAAHRLAWLFIHGKFPNDQIDHINGVRDDNRIENLRDVDQFTNARNIAKRNDNTSGITGVCWHKVRNKWESRINIDGRKLHLGLFDCKATASYVAKHFRRKNGFTIRHGN